MTARILYNLVYSVLLAPAAGLFALLRPARFAAEFKASAAQRLGFYPRESLPRDGDAPVMIFRCASLGETKAAVKLMSRIDGFRKVVAAGTLAARDYAAGRIGKRDAVFTPPDIFFFAARFFRLFRPASVVFVESDLWPEFLKCAKESGASAILANGRFSPSTAAAFRRWKFFAVRLLELMDLLLVRYGSDAEALKSAGASPEKISALGNVKYDFDDPPQSAARDSLGYSDGEFVLVAGSTHADDETVLAAALKGIFAEFPGFRLVVAPRHIERAANTMSLMAEFSPVLLSAAAAPGGPAPACLVVDKIGELDKYYSVADAAFVGGSFGARGGQEPMTPAFFGKPVIYGPNMSKFADETARLEAAGGAIRAGDAARLSEIIARFARDRTLARETGLRAQEASAADAGAASRAARRIAEFMSGR